ncbi:MAG TPA: terminase, partial [Clostridiales bacterium]|nr:terminase [Clostridiales bacterium]
MSEQLLLSPKYKAFLKYHEASVEFLEGTTLAGKTTIGTLKFMLKVAESPKKFHILAGLDLGTIEKNIINKELGILDVFGPLVQYNAGGKGQYSLPHIVYRDKIIYVFGYDNKARWKKALGGQYGCLYIDEINIADMEFVREAAMRCDYMIATLNPDDPDLPIYDEYINHSRPLPEYA